MFEIGGLELLVIAIVALIALGPEKFPDTVIFFIRLFNKAKRAAVEFQRSLFTEIALKEEQDKKKPEDSLHVNEKTSKEEL